MVADLAVVVMGYRNEATIAGAVGSVVDQARLLSAGSIEVVVVASGEDDRSVEVLSVTHPEVEVVWSPSRLFAGGARNVGLRATSAPLVAFLAADCLAEPGWVSARLHAHRSGRPVVAGAMVAAPPWRPSGWASHVALFARRLPGRGPGPVVPPDPGAHGLSFERTVFDIVGEFDDSVRVSEDTELAGRVAAAGVPIWFEPAVRTAHHGPRGAVALARQHHERGVRAALAADEGQPPIGLARAVVGVAWSTARRTASAVRVAWDCAPSARAGTVVCLPWLLLAHLSAAVGRAEVRRGRRGTDRHRRPSS